MLQVALVSFFPFLMIYSAFSDLVSMTIPNKVSLALMAGFVLFAWWTGMDMETFAWHWALFAIVLVTAIVIFAFGQIGGGDAKLFAATAPWLGLGSLGVFLFNTAIAGLVLAITMAMFRKLPVLPVYAHAPWLIRLHERKKDLPYAVAIAAGALLSFSQTPYFQLVIGG